MLKHEVVQAVHALPEVIDLVTKATELGSNAGQGLLSGLEATEAGDGVQDGAQQPL